MLGSKKLLKTTSLSDSREMQSHEKLEGKISEVRLILPGFKKKTTIATLRTVRSIVVKEQKSLGGNKLLANKNTTF